MNKILMLVIAVSLSLALDVQPANAQATKAIKQFVKSASKIKVKSVKVKPVKVKPSGKKTKSLVKKTLKNADNTTQFIPCSQCNGTGYVYFQNNRFICAYCKGTGKSRNNGLK